MLFRQEGSCFSTVDQSDPRQVGFAQVESRPWILRIIAIQASVSKYDLGWLEAACPSLPLEDDDVCADNPDPPEVLTRMVVVVLKSVRVMLMVVTIVH